HALGQPRHGERGAAGIEVRHGRACPGHPRLTLLKRGKDVDARHEAGHDENCYFHPASLLHAACSRGWLFSHCVIDWVSLSLILLFMQVQYFSTTSFFAPSFLLSSTQRLIHFTSSVVAAS